VRFGMEIVRARTRALVLGPERLHTMGHMAQAKTRFEEASCGPKSELSAELDAVHQGRKSDCPQS
jgi:hypothetical protein